MTNVPSHPEPPGSRPDADGVQGRRFLRRALAAWALILVVAMANGALREAVLVPRFGVRNGLMASGLVLLLVVLVVARAVVRGPPALTARAALRLGTLWLALTLLFEFSAGALAGKPLDELVAPYRFENGNLWPLVLLAVFAGPSLWRWIGHRASSSVSP